MATVPLVAVIPPSGVRIYDEVQPTAVSNINKIRMIVFITYPPVVGAGLDVVVAGLLLFGKVLFVPAPYPE